MASAAAPDLPGPGGLLAASPPLLAGRAHGPRSGPGSGISAGIAAGLAVRRPWWLLRHQLLLQRMRPVYVAPAATLTTAPAAPGALATVPGRSPAPRDLSRVVAARSPGTAPPALPLRAASPVAPRRPALSTVAYAGRGEPYSADVRAADLRVLGGVLTPAPDPGTVRFDPPRPGPIAAHSPGGGPALGRVPAAAPGSTAFTTSGTARGTARGTEPVIGRGGAPARSPGSGHSGGRAAHGDGDHGGGRAATDRWRAAVAARPLETPRPFPAAFSPVLRSMRGGAGPTTPPRYTTGPATRAALDAAGALGASTGPVVHLPALPSPGGPARLFGVLAHELAHAGRPLPRTRFLLRTPDGAADAEERDAHRTGETAHRHAATPVVHSPGLVSRLPVGGAAGLSGALGAGATRPATTTATATAAGHGGGETAGDPQWTGERGWPGEGVWRMLEDAPPQDTAADPDAGPGGEPAAAEPAAAPPQQQQGATPARAGAAPGVDLDALVHAVQERVIQQLERRGGRYAGLF